MEETDPRKLRRNLRILGFTAMGYVLISLGYLFYCHLSRSIERRRSTNAQEELQLSNTKLKSQVDSLNTVISELSKEDR